MKKFSFVKNFTNKKILKTLSKETAFKKFKIVPRGTKKEK